MSERPRLLALISGTGRNLQAIIDAIGDGSIPADMVATISNRPHAMGLDKAAQAGITTEVIDHTAFRSREEFDAALANGIDKYKPDIIVLAGFMRILTPGFVRRYEGRMFNIHPSLLPKYPGLHTHQRALDAGDAKHGASVHYVTSELDGGPVVLQGSLNIHEDDTAESLADRVMQEVELFIYPQALAWAASGRLELLEAGVAFDGQLLDAPLTWETSSADL